VGPLCAPLLRRSASQNHQNGEVQRRGWHGVDGMAKRGDLHCATEWQRGFSGNHAFTLSDCGGNALTCESGQPAQCTPR
jgi:hypothetical protein